MRTRIAKWGNSLGIRIPKPFILESGLEDGAEVEIAIDAGKIVLTPVAQEYSLEQLTAQITPANRHGETDWGKPVGHEAV